MEREPGAPPAQGVEFKATLLLLLLLLLVAGTVAYVLYARGAFEDTQRLVLTVDDAEGVRVGMDLTFSGFPIGRVRRIELGADGVARIVIDVPRKDAHWLRTSSVFVLTRNLLGGTSLKAYSGILTDPPLADGAVRSVLVGDATAEIPRLLADARELVRNLAVLTAADSPLAASLANLQAVTAKMNGPRGALAALFGNERDAQKVVAALDRANALLARLDRLVGTADAQMFGADGVVPEARAAAAQLTATLGAARATLTNVDALLVEAQAVARNARVASADLDALRGEVEASLRKVQWLIDEVNRLWPFARDTE
ncbi:MAG TPA: MlaD family protein, partial [Burkholderiaceae bacterium]|nr:MlaD family protein [Burkholderiaceae bacterium]